MDKLARWLGVLLLSAALIGCAGGGTLPEDGGAPAATETAGPALKTVTPDQAAGQADDAGGPAATPTKDLAATPAPVQEAPAGAPYVPRRSDGEILTATDMAEAGIVLVYQQMGGLMGIGPDQYVWNFYADGRITDSEGRSWQVPPADIQQLVDQAVDDGFMAMDDTYLPADTCCDRFYYVLTIRQADQVHTVTTIDAAEAPGALWDSLEQIQAYLMALPA